jgi:bisanhydrobacterioruberin hydratase
MILKQKIKISIIVAALFHFSGFMGLMTNAKPWFVSMTPLTLLLMFGLLIWTEENKGVKYYQYLGLVFFAGLLVEIIGVNTGLLFGDYTYGDVMGLKIFGVPLLMGIQWFATLACSAHMIQYLFHKNKFSSLYFALIAATITTIFDVAIEPVAMDFDYWNWNSDHVPLYNYICWFVISFILHWLKEQYFKTSKVNFFGVVLFILQVVFFIFLNLYQWSMHE